MIDNPQDEPALARALAKARARVVPLLFLGYAFAIIDRGNIALAALTMNRDLRLSATLYGWATTAFFIGYLVFELPSNLCLHRVGARIWIARIMFTWGLVSIATSFISGPTSLLILRFLLGAGEAGFLPGVLLYLTYWFPDRRRTGVTAAFVLAIPVVGAVGSALSGAILHLNGVLGLAGWRWLFLVEGLPALGMAAVIWRWLPERPSSVAWLSEAERTSLETALHGGGRPAARTGLGVGAALRTPLFWVLGAINLGFIICTYAVSYWLPQVLAGYSYGPGRTGLTAGLVSAAGAVGIFGWARLCERAAPKPWMIAAPLGLGGAGMVGAIFALNQPGLAVAAFCVASAGLYAAIPTFWTLTSSTASGRMAATGLALVNSIGSLSGLIGPPLIGYLKDRTHGFQAGFASMLIFLAVSIALVLTYRFPAAHSAEA